MAKDGDNRPEIDERIAVVDAWFGKFDLVAQGVQDMEKLEPELLREVLAHFGADFDSHDSPERQAALMKLKQSTNLWQRPGVEAVWGTDYVESYEGWLVGWADEYEARTGRLLPRVTKADGTGTGSRISGMKHWLGEVTAYAAGAIGFEEYQEMQQARLRNGYARAVGGELHEVSFLADNKKLPGSIPPGFSSDAWARLKSREGETDDNH